MPCQNYTTLEHKNETKTLVSSIKNEERIVLGCKAISGISVTEISSEYRVNRQFIYDQKNKVEDILDKTFNKTEEKAQVLILDENTIEKTIVACMVICKGSENDTQEFIKSIYKIHVSIGKISKVINEASERALKWNNSIELNGIIIGANDEIFQGNKPVLVGVDPKSTYTYLMQETKNRDSTTWGVTLLEKEKQGLNLKTSVNDGGTGLNKGVKDAFPNINVQADVFHAEKDISFATISFERKAYKDIKEEYIAENKFLRSKNPTDKLLAKYDVALEKSKISIDIYDRIKILYTWLIEVFGMGGYNYNDKEELLKFIVKEMEELPNGNAYLKKGILFLSENSNNLLHFVKEAENLMCDFSKKESIDMEILKKMWEQQQYSYSSAKYNILEGEIGTLLDERYTEIREKWNSRIKEIVRASSLVECINSLIRPYLFLKRAVPGKFLDLLQFYFNTRKYTRSRVTERIGKSPIELLTGLSYEDPLTILGY
jgi:predicted DNA-binding protein YlxM (UPF0122 family)